MERVPKNKFTILNYHNENNRYGLRENTATLREVFVTLEADVYPASEKEKVLNLTDIIVDDKLFTGTVYSILSISSMYGNFNAADTRLGTTAIHLKIINTSGDGQGGELDGAKNSCTFTQKQVNVTR